MSMHGKDKISPVQDDVIKKEMEGELRSGHSTRVREERELEPPGEDQPEVGFAPGMTLTGGTPRGMRPDDVGLRAEIAQHLGRSLYPADREAVLGALRRSNAPDRLVGLAAGLPAGERFRNVQDIARALGLGVEEHRT